MKKILSTIFLLLAFSTANAAQQEINAIGTPATMGEFRTSVNDRLGKIDSNTDELYSADATLNSTKANKSEVVQQWSGYSNGTSFNLNHIVAYDGKLWKAVISNTKSSGNYPGNSGGEWEEFVSGTGGGGSTNLSASPAASSVTINSDSGTDATISSANSNQAGVMTAADKAKLDTVATNATANASDAYLLALSNHTGTLPATSVSGLQAWLWADTRFDSVYTKVLGIASGAEVNVNADWNASSGDAQILNKPSILSASADTVVTGELDIQDGIIGYFDTLQFNSQGSEPSCAAGAYFIYSYGGVFKQCLNGTASAVGSGSGTMTYPSAGIPQSTGSAWGSSLTLDTDLSSVSSTDNSLPSAKAVKAAIDAVSVASGIDHRTSDPDDPATGYTWIRTDTGNEAIKSATATGILSADLTFTADDFTPSNAAGWFDAVTDADLNTAYISSAETLAGLGGRKTSISVSGDSGCGYSLNDTACTSSAGKVVNGDKVEACVTSSGSNSTETTCDVTVGTVTEEFSVTTAASSITYLINETFEGTGFPSTYFDSGNSSSSGIDYDYTTTVLSGTQSAYGDNTGTNLSLTSSAFASQTTVYFGMKFQPKTLTGNQIELIQFLDNLNARGLVYWYQNGTISAAANGGTIDSSSSGVIQVGTTIYIKARVVSGTGSNSTVTVWTSTNGTSWTQQASSTNGTFTGNWERVRIKWDSALDAIIDDVKVANEDFNM